MIHAKTSTLKYYYTINLHTVQSDHTLERNIFDKSYAEKPLFFHTVQRVEHSLVPVDVKERFPRAEPVHNGRLLGRPFLGEPQDVRRLLQRDHHDAVRIPDDEVARPDDLAARCRWGG